MIFESPNLKFWLKNTLSIPERPSAAASVVCRLYGKWGGQTRRRRPRLPLPSQRGIKLLHVCRWRRRFLEALWATICSLIEEPHTGKKALS